MWRLVRDNFLFTPIPPQNFTPYNQSLMSMNSQYSSGTIVVITINGEARMLRN